MKIIMLLISLTFLDKGCVGNQADQDTISIEYTAHSRGMYNHIVINNKTISVVDKRDTKPTIKPCNQADWQNIIDLLKTIDIENIPNLKAPTEARFYDGAAMASLKINYNGKTYETTSFDHGHPPKNIEILVKEILSIAKNIE